VGHDQPARLALHLRPRSSVARGHTPTRESVKAAGAAQAEDEPRRRRGGSEREHQRQDDDGKVKHEEGRAFPAGREGGAACLPKEVCCLRSATETRTSGPLASAAALRALLHLFLPAARPYQGDADGPLHLPGRRASEARDEPLLGGLVGGGVHGCGASQRSMTRAFCREWTVDFCAPPDAPRAAQRAL